MGNLPVFIELGTKQFPVIFSSSYPAIRVNPLIYSYDKEGS